MFFNWSMMVSMMARLRRSKRSPSGINRCFILRSLFCNELDACGFEQLFCQLLRDIANGLQTLCQTTAAPISGRVCGHRCCRESARNHRSSPRSFTTRCSLNPLNQSTEVLPRAAKSSNTLCCLMRRLWQTLNAVESMKLMPLH